MDAGHPVSLTLLTQGHSNMKPQSSRNCGGETDLLVDFTRPGSSGIGWFAQSLYRGPRPSSQCDHTFGATGQFKGLEVGGIRSLDEHVHVIPLQLQPVTFGQRANLVPLKNQVPGPGLLQNSED